MGDFQGRDVAALVIAVGVTVSVVILCLTVAFQSTTISTQGASLLDSVLSVMVGSVATYMGYRIGSDTAGSKEPPPGPSRPADKP